jgi:fimbrial chaperone protein
MRTRLHAGLFFFIAVAVFVSAQPARAGALRVEPVLLDVPGSGATTSLTLRNDGDKPVHVQIRVFGWTGTQGEPVLVPTSDVVVSPPAATLSPGMEYVVRVVRLSKQPVASEESYRILVDELPDAAQQQGTSIRFALRYSIPVFFSASGVPPAKVAWTMQTKGNVLTLTAANSGGRRLRIANLKLADAAGAVLLQRKGLVGYALGKSATAWSFPADAQVARHGSLNVLADTEAGSIDVAVASQILH